MGELVPAPSDVFLDEVNVLQPDLYYISNGQRNLIVEGGVKGAPDLVIEILSPSNSERDRNEKREIYARAGVQEMWIVDPETHQVELHSLTLGLNSSPKIVREPEPFSSSFFPDLEIDTVRLFKPVL